MARERTVRMPRLSSPFLWLALFLAIALSCGCGQGSNRGEGPPEAQVRQCLQDLASRPSFSFRVRLETRVGVSGYEVIGEEEGEGTVAGEDFSVVLTRRSPEEEADYTFSSRGGIFYLAEGGVEKEVQERDLPSPLYAPRRFLEVFSTFHGMEEEDREARDSISCRVFRLEYDPSLSAEILPVRAMEYYTNLEFQLRGWVWVDDASFSPVAMTLELIGLDRVEKLQRLRQVFSFQPLPGE